MKKDELTNETPIDAKPVLAAVPSAVTFIVEDYSGFEPLGTTSKQAVTIELTADQRLELWNKMKSKCQVLDCYADYRYSS